MSQRNYSIILLMLAVSYACHVRADRVRHARYLGQAIHVIEQRALDPPTRQELFDGAMRGMVDVLHKRGDEHSHFFSSKRAARFLNELKQEIVGIGVRLRLKAVEGKDEPQLTVVETPLPGTPAREAGIRKDDRILAVNGQKVAGMEMDEVLLMIQGAEGDAVTLTLERDDAPKPFDVSIVRGTIELPSVVGDLCDKRGKWEYLLPPDGRIGYVRIREFGDKTADEMRTVLESLLELHVEGLVLDLRDNPGGPLEVAVEVCEMFLEKNQEIVSIYERKNVRVRDYRSSEDGMFLETPIAVLVNQNSASASEILAACLKDNGRAVVVGERSFGKGTVQQLIPMEGGRSQLKLTSAKYVRPSGKNIHRASRDTPESEDWGVSPDKGSEVKLTDEEAKAWREARLTRDEAGLADRHPNGDLPPLVDPVRDRAVEYLREKASGD